MSGSALAVWRDVDTGYTHLGLVVTRTGLTAYVGRRTYRARWAWR